MVSTLSGIVTPGKLLQQANEKLPISVTLSGIMTSTNPLHPQHIFFPILVTPSSITRLVILASPYTGLLSL